MTVFPRRIGWIATLLLSALALAAGKPVEKKVYIPFVLVTPANMEQLTKKN